MKVALVHELLTMKGGAERMLRILADMYPDAPIYTLLYDEKKLGDWFPKERIRPSSLQKFAHSSQLIAHSFAFNHHLYLPFSPRAVESWPFDKAQGDIVDFDLVISSSSAFAHGIITNGKPKHLCYVHSPARYLWDRTHEVMQGRRWYLSHLFHRLRIWDAESADRPDMLLAASKTVQRRIELYWRRDSTVLYPPLDDCWIEQSQTTQRCHSELVEERHRVMVRQAHHDTRCTYFLVVSTLAPYKRIDIAIEACNQLRLPLKIAGSGPDRKRLEHLAGPTVEFLGFIPEENLPTLYHGATATLFPGDEDFGLVPLESMACGTPVIAYRAGGALETIKENITGAFFKEPTAASLAETLRHFDRTRFAKEACRVQAQKFSREIFEKGIREAVETLFVS